MVDWEHVLIAVLVAFCTIGLPSMITAFGAIWLSWRNLSAKIEQNNAMTKSGAAAAVSNAKLAADNAISAKNGMEALNETLESKLNGQLDERITKIVTLLIAPLVKQFENHAKQFREHNEQDNRNMEAMTTAIRQLSENTPDIATKAAKVAVDHVASTKDSDAFSKGLEAGIELGKQKERLEMEREQQHRNG